MPRHAPARFYPVPSVDGHYGSTGLSSTHTRLIPCPGAQKQRIGRAKPADFSQTGYRLFQARRAEKTLSTGFWNFLLPGSAR